MKVQLLSFWELSYGITVLDDQRSSETTAMIRTQEIRGIIDMADEPVKVLKFMELIIFTAYYKSFLYYNIFMVPCKIINV